MKDNPDEVEVVEYTVRAPCRSCGRLYVWPKGSRAPGGIGPCCQLSLLDDVRLGIRDLGDDDEASPEDTTPPDTPPRDLGHLGLQDVLCEGCRTRPADGRLTPGVALCVGCADETVEHWLAWVADSRHDWWPSDDPFGSARHPVHEWRATEPI